MCIFLYFLVKGNLKLGEVKSVIQYHSYSSDRSAVCCTVSLITYTQLLKLIECSLTLNHFLKLSIRTNLLFFFIELFIKKLTHEFNCWHLVYSSKSYLSQNRRDGVVIRASASKSVDLGFISRVWSYQKTLKNDIYSFPAWRSAFRGGYGEQAGKFACCVLGQGT